jgi:hypothetical protein
MVADQPVREANPLLIGDLREQSICRAIVDRRFDEVCQLAAGRVTSAVEKIQ